MMVYTPAAQQVYSTVSSRLVNVHDLTEVRLRVRDAPVLLLADRRRPERWRGAASGSSPTDDAVRKTGTGHSLTIGNVYDEAQIGDRDLDRGRRRSV